METKLKQSEKRITDTIIKACTLCSLLIGGAVGLLLNTETITTLDYIVRGVMFVVVAFYMIRDA